MLLLENESHQTAVAIVEEEDQFADCLELVSVMLISESLRSSEN